jgi:hypothetical protein
VAGAAEQQASVGGEPVIIQADFLVAQRQVLRDQLLGPSDSGSVAMM